MVKESNKKFERFIKDLKNLVEGQFSSRPNEKPPVYDIRCLNSQFIFIYTLPEANIEFAGGFENFMGYTNDSIKDRPETYLELIHPDDIEKLMQLAKRMHEFYLDDENDSIRNVFMVDYRIKKSNGEYARVISHIAPIVDSHDSVNRRFISICNNISHIKISGEVNWKMTGPDAERFNHQDEVERFLENEIFSKREQEILELLYEGKSSTDIATELFISRNTVDTHRRNMLRKAKVRSTLELLLFGIEHDQIKSRW